MSIRENLEHYLSTSIFRVIELCFHQNVTTTWRDIYQFLRVPEYIWADEPDLDERIIINSFEELEMMRELLTANFNTKH